MSALCATQMHAQEKQALKSAGTASKNFSGDLRSLPCLRVHIQHDPAAGIPLVALLSGKPVRTQN
jgi:hypothetical protein